MSRRLPIPLARSAPLDGALRAGLVPHVAFVALAVLMAAPVAAQTVAASFDGLRIKVKAGDMVYVTDDSGKSEQEARILDLSASSLAVSNIVVRPSLTSQAKGLNMTLRF